MQTKNSRSDCFESFLFEDPFESIFGGFPFNL